MRIRTILAAAAAPAALAAIVLGTAGQASAATLNNPAGNPGNGAVVIRTQADADHLPYLVTQNVSVVAPASANVWIGYHEIQGNLNVTGHVTLAADVLDRDVNVGGPNGYLDFSNQASHIKGSLNVTGSAGEWVGAQANVSLDNNVQYPNPNEPQLGTVVQVDGNLNFTGNTSQLRIQYPMHVNGKFTYANNTVTAWWGDTLPFNQSWVSGLTADGGQFVS
jgi:hypothetical protein